MTGAKLKTAVVVLALLFYVYLLMFIKTFYLKSKKIDHILEMTIETDKKILNIHNMDEKLAISMAQLDKL